MTTLRDASMPLSQCVGGCCSNVPEPKRIARRAGSSPRCCARAGAGWAGVAEGAPRSTAGGDRLRRLCLV